MTTLGFMVGVALFFVVEVLYQAFEYVARKRAEATKDEWWPEIKGDAIKYVDVSNLTLPQAQVFMEDFKKKL